MSVKIYTSPTCHWCAKAKQWLNKNKIKYTEKNVVDDAKALNEMITKSGQSGVPVFDINGVIITGFDLPVLRKALTNKT